MLRLYSPPFGWPILIFGLLLATGCGEKVELADLATLGPDEVAVAATDPGSQQLKISQPLGVTFSQPLAPEGYQPGTYLEDPPASLTPGIQGFWKWSQPDQLEFVPNENYQPNTQYRLELERSIATARSLKLRGPRVFVFTAEPFCLTAGHIYRDRLPGQYNSLRIAGTFEFNHPVAVEAFRQAFTLRLEQRGALAYEIEETEDESTVVSFISEPFERGERNEKLTATIARSLRPARGGAALAEEIVRTEPIPAIERLSVERLSPDNDQETRRVRLQLNERVDPGDLKTAMTISPQIEDLIISDDGQGILLTGPWEFGVRYKIRLAADLRSQQGLVLERAFEGSILIENLNPSVMIAGEGHYLSLRGEQTLAVETVNVAKLTVEVDRIYANNLVHFLQERNLGGSGYSHHWNLQDYGRNIYRRDRDVASSEANRLVVTPILLDEVISDDSRGILQLSVRHGENRGLQDSKLIVATDLGLVAKKSAAELQVGVVSIRDLQPLADVDVQVISRNNQVLFDGKTDAEGMARFTGPGADDIGEQPFLIVATREGDLSFLKFEDTWIGTGDMDVGGVGRAGDRYQAFLYTDRGIYRPDDTAHIAWIVRDGDRQVPPQFPLTLLVRGPQGREFAQTRVTSGAAGSGESTLEIPRWAQTGSYAVDLQLDARTTIGRASFLVEDFIPDRMKVGLRLLVDDEPAGLVRPGQSLIAEATALTLFGPAAADRKASGGVTFRAEPARFDAWPDFTFGDAGKPPRVQPTELAEQPTDDQGVVRWQVPWPELQDYHGWLRASAVVNVTELGGGRSVQADHSAVLSPVERLVGLHQPLPEGSDYAEPGQPIAFDAVVVDLDAEPLATEGATLRVFRKRWRTVLRKDSAGRYRYISEHDEQLVEERTLDLAARVHRLEVTVDSHGSYRLVLVTADGAARGALDFYVYGWGYAPWAMSNPEKVNLKLDREAYRAGDRLSASVEAPFAGLMLLTIERERVHHQQWVRLEANTATVEIRLPAGLEPNAYLTATLLRPLDSLEKHAPARAFGAVPIFIDKAPSTLAIEVQVPETTRPRRELRVRFRLPELATGQTAPVSIAAVDEGILQITDFATPSPLNFFLQRRRLALQTHDIWSLLLPEYESILRQSSPGGGDELYERGGRSVGVGLPIGMLNPLAVKRVEPVALWSGILEGSRGWQTVSFDLPQHNGALRIMAVGAAGPRFGSADALLRVADPIVLSPNLPRFLAPGDEITIPVQVYNGLTEKSGDVVPIQIAMQMSGPVAPAAGQPAALQLDIAGGKERVGYLMARADDAIGTAVFTVTGEALGERVAMSTEMAVRPPQPRQSEGHSGVVREGEPVSVTLGSRWYPGTARTTITASPLPVAQFGAALPYLLQYPYGCLEQKTSRSLPLLYFAEFARELAPEAFGDQDADYFINSGIDYVVALSRPGGGFSLWPGGGRESDNPWVSVYATHFLVEAARRGFVVPDHILQEALAHLAGLARNSDRGWDGSWSAQQRLHARAYASYVLAMAGQPERGAMDYMVQNELDNLNMAARAHLAGAFALIGNTVQMEQLLPAQPSPATDERSLGYTFWSAARDEAILLEVLATVAPESKQVPVVLQRLAQRARNGRWHNTQENAFALLALGKLASTGVARPAPAEVLLDGEVVAAFSAADTAGVTVLGEDWAGRQVEIRATGPGTAYCSILDTGIPLEGAERNVSKGVLVTRSYFDADGEPVDLDRITQGQVVVCRLALSSEKGHLQNVVVSDLVPAGLEIENPRLVQQTGFDWIKQLDAQERRPLPIEHLEVRDDRLLLFTSARPQQHVYFYSLRAVTAGRFVLPPVKAEAMYDPDVRSIQDSGEITIVAP